MQARTALLLAAVCLVAVSLLFLGASGTVGADSEYEITVPGSIDTPTREVNVQGATYEVSSIAKADIGDSVDVDVTAPDENDQYRVYLYDSDGNIVAGSNLLTGNGTATFDITEDAGTYSFAVQDQGTNEVIHPLVIKGYDTSVSAPGSATVGDDIEVDVTITQIESNVTNDRVEVVVADETQDITATATGDDGEYTATVDTDEFDAGTYDVYATVRGEKTVFGRKVLYGVSDAQPVELEAADSSDTPTESDDGGGGAGGGGAGGGAVGGGGGTAASDTATSTATSTPTPETATPINLTPTTPTPVDTETDTPVNPGTDVDTPAPDTSGDSGDATASATGPASPTTDAADVVTPATGSPGLTETNSPGFDVAFVGTVTFLALILFSLWSGRGG